MSDLRSVLAEAALRLSLAGVESPRLDARLLLAHALGMRPDAVIGTIDIPADARSRFEEFLARRVRREPVAYITGRKEFWGLEFAVGRGVLVPRPETETLIEEATDSFPDRSAPLRAVDFGTGTGCLLLAFLSEYPNAQGVGIDMSDAALAYARENAGRLGLESRCRFEQGSWKGFSGFGADVALANPPYIRSDDIPGLSPEVRLYEPVDALDAGADGLEAFRSLAPELRRTLRPGGLALVEIGAGQDRSAAAIMDQAGLAVRRIAPDLAGIGRCLVAERLQ